MKKVTIISILGIHSAVEQNLTLASNLSSAGYEFQLYVAMNGSYVPFEFNETFDVFQPKCWCFPLEHSYSELINKMLQKVDTELICLLPNDLYLDNNWLSDMVFYNDLIEKSGIGIISSDKKGVYTNFLTRDNDLEYLSSPHYDSVVGCIIFDQNVVSSLGSFNESFHGNWPLCDYAVRALRSGFNNYFIPLKNAIKLEIKTLESWRPRELTHKELIDQPIYRKLCEIDEVIDHAFSKAETLASQIYSSLIENFEEFSFNVNLQKNAKANTFSIKSPIFTKHELDLIDKFAINQKIEWHLMPSSKSILCVFSNKNK